MSNERAVSALAELPAPVQEALVDLVDGVQDVDPAELDQVLAWLEAVVERVLSASSRPADALTARVLARTALVVGEVTASRHEVAPVESAPAG